MLWKTRSGPPESGNRHGEPTDHQQRSADRRRRSNGPRPRQTNRVDRSAEQNDTEKEGPASQLRQFSGFGRRQPPGTDQRKPMDHLVISGLVKRRHLRRRRAVGQGVGAESGKRYGKKPVERPKTGEQIHA